MYIKIDMQVLAYLPCSEILRVVITVRLCISSLVYFCILYRMDGTDF